MEFWPENQGQAHLYSSFGAAPGRNYTHNYHDRYQAHRYPLHYGELQDQSREPGYLTVAASRTGGAPQKYTSWMDPELTAPATAHLPFIADSHSQQRRDLGEYQPHEARDKEWTAVQRAAREYESGFLRGGWQRRWEDCSPVRYNREVSTKRSDSSCRELEAWAARYSHSLPRRRRIEAELRGSSPGLWEGARALERDTRRGTDPRVAALQQVMQSANIRELGLWDRGSRQQALTNYSSQTPITGTSHMLDVKEKTGYKRMTLSHPPGYMAPPPYNSPHKGSPVLQHSDTSCEGRRQTCWSQPSLKTQEVSVDPRNEKEDFTKPDVAQYIVPELEGLTHQRQETDALQASSTVSSQRPHTQCEDRPCLPQALQAAQDQKLNEKPSPKVIEGRKFRLNKKTGGMTIFCLVSRIAGTAETPSLPLCTAQVNITDTELRDASEGQSDSGGISQTHKLADEVDFREPTPAEQPDISDVRNLKVTQEDTQACDEKEQANKAETVAKSSTNDADGRQVSQPVSVKYPLWREPYFTSRTGTESPSTCLKAPGEGDISAGINPFGIELRRLDIKSDTKSDSEGLLVIDTTCVVVKMEVIPSPKKKQVQYCDYTGHTTHNPLEIQSNISNECVSTQSPSNQDVTSDQNAETNPKCINESLEAELDSHLAKKKATKAEGEISFPCISSASGSEKETVEEHAEGIPGILQHYCTTEQEPRDERSLLDLCLEEEQPSTEDNGIDNAEEEIPEDTTEDEPSQIEAEVDQTEDVRLRDTCELNDKGTNDGSEDFDGCQKQISTISEENNVDSHLGPPTPGTNNLPETEMTDDLNLKSAGEEDTAEQNQEEDHTVENEIYSEHPSQCLSPPTNPSNKVSLLPSVNCDAPNPALSLMPPSPDPVSLYISESTTEEEPDPELIAHNAPVNTTHYPESLPIPQTPSEQMPPPHPPGSAGISQSSSPQAGSSPHDLINLTPEETSGAEDQDEECETSALISNDISDDLDVTEELVLTHEFEGGKGENAYCVKKRNVNDEHKTQELNKESTHHIMEPIDKTSQDNSTKSNILHELENIQDEDVADVTQSSVAEEQQPKEVSEDPEGLMKTTIRQENVIMSQTEASILQQQCDNGQEEEASCPKEKFETGKQTNTEAYEGPAGLLEKTISRENATDPQIQIQLENLQEIEPRTEPASTSPSPSELACEASQSSLDALSLAELPSLPLLSHKSDTDFDSLAGTCSPSALNPVDDDAISETVPSPVHLDPCEESFNSSPSSSLPIFLLPSGPTGVLQKGSGCVSPDLTLNEEPQYPKSLWDAVNRIRKHTAPDSENEEEEVSDLWDPESVAKDLGGPDVVDNVDFEKLIFSEAEQQEVSAEGSVDGAAVVKIQQGPCQEEPSGHGEGDSLFCSSASSHSSEDTVIIADDDEFEEMPPNAGRETTSAHNEESKTPEGELC